MKQFVKEALMGISLGLSILVIAVVAQLEAPFIYQGF